MSGALRYACLTRGETFLCASCGSLSSRDVIWEQRPFPEPDAPYCVPCKKAELVEQFRERRARAEGRLL